MLGVLKITENHKTTVYQKVLVVFLQLCLVTWSIKS